MYSFHDNLTFVDENVICFVFSFHNGGHFLRQLNILKRIGAVDVKEGRKFIVPIVCRNIV